MAGNQFTDEPRQETVGETFLRVEFFALRFFLYLGMLLSFFGGPSGSSESGRPMAGVVAAICLGFLALTSSGRRR